MFRFVVYIYYMQKFYSKTYILTLPWHLILKQYILHAKITNKYVYVFMYIIDF